MNEGMVPLVDGKGSEMVGEKIGLEKMSESCQRGRLTIPIETGMEKRGLELARFLGADEVRDCDGVVMPREILGRKEFAVVSTVCLVRDDQEWARKHPEARTQRYLVTPRRTAPGAGKLTIRLMEDFYAAQYEPDVGHDEKKYWEVIDRTAGEVVAPANWTFDRRRGTVTVHPARAGHEYTVSFLAGVVWDSTSMYNYKINRWTGEHVVPVDPRHPPTRRRLLGYLEEWLRGHPRTEVVRLTSLTYHFPVIMAPDGKKIKFRDWYGYQEGAGVYALDEFCREYGYRLRPEDLVDDGYYRRIDRLPTKGYVDWMDFQQRFVGEWGKEVVGIIHRHRRKALLFWCDHWIGAEPYGRYFSKMNLDGVVIPAHTGFHVRSVAGFPGKQSRELRLQPYFFPDRFGPGFDNAGKLQGYWVDERRALLRDPVDRIGFGGYLGIAAKEEKFLETMKRVADEFRSIQERTGGEKSVRLPVTIGVLSVWGKLRSWQSTGTYIYVIPFVSELYQGISGLPFEFRFLSFAEIRNHVPEGIDVLVNAGAAGSAFSGGEVWRDERLVRTLTGWVGRGGAFIGIGAPSEFRKGGKTWQMRNVLGVERDPLAAFPLKIRKHWVLPDQPVDGRDVSEWVKDVQAISGTVEILLAREGGVFLSVNRFGKGRTAYLAGYRYEPAFTRLLHRLFCWAARKEKVADCWSAADAVVEVAYYPKSKVIAAVNNGSKTVSTEIHGGKGKKLKTILAPYELKWISPRIKA